MSTLLAQQIAEIATEELGTALQFNQTLRELERDGDNEKLKEELEFITYYHQLMVEGQSNE